MFVNLSLMQIGATAAILSAEGGRVLVQIFNRDIW